MELDETTKRLTVIEAIENLHSLLALKAGDFSN